jgi:hypothetical protein
MSLFSLFVDLKANTADFVSGMNSASSAARKAGRDIEDSFSRLSDVAESALRPFGALGEGIANSLSLVSRAASSATEELSKLGGGMTAVSVAGGAAVGILAGVSAGAIGIAVHTAETADKMLTLSKQTGISVGSLSTWSFVAKQSGVDQETMAKSLQMLSLNMLKAATSAPGTITAFQRLGLSVRDGNKDLKDAGDMMSEVITKLASMKDQTAAVGLARQLMGRGGDAVLAIDPDEIQPLIDKARELGIVLDDQTALASHKFVESLGNIEAAGDGLALQLTRELLPALQEVAAAFEAKAGDTGFIHDIAVAVEATLGVIDTLWSGLKQIWVSGIFALEELGTPLVTIWVAAADIIEGHFSDAWKEIKGGAADMVDYYHQAAAESGQIWADNAKFIEGLAPKPKSPFDVGLDFFAAHPKPKGGANLGAPSIQGVAPTDTTADMISKLAEQASAELALAAATGESTAAQLLSKAAAEADVKIAETRTALLDRERTLRQQLAAALASAHPEEGAKYQAEISAVQKYLSELDSAIPQIRLRYEEIALAKNAVSTNDELQKETLGYDRQIASLDEFISAYRQGGAAIASAGIDKSLEGDSQKVAELAEEFARLVAIEPTNITAMAELGVAVQAANAQLEEHRKQLETIRSLEISAEIGKETAAFHGEVAALEQLAAAYLKGADAVREAQVQLKVAQFKSANPGASAIDVANYTALARQQSNVAYAGSIGQEAAQYNPAQQYSDQVEKLLEVKAALESVGASTLAVDAAIYDANERNIQQWDTTALKVGSLGDKMHAMFDQIELEGQNWGEKVFETLSKSVDDISTQLAKFVVTGKSNFKQLFDSLAEQVLKIQFQRTFAGIAGLFSPEGSGQGKGAQTGSGSSAGAATGIVGIFSKLFGGPEGTKRDGSSAGSALYVIEATGAFGNLSRTAPGAAPAIATPGDDSGQGLEGPFDIFGPSSTIGPGGTPGVVPGPLGLADSFASLFGQPSGSTPPAITPPAPGLPGLAGPLDAIASIRPASPQENPALDVTKTLASVMGQLGKTLPSIFKSIGGFFGGFLAGGGDVSPGKAYVVGEKHPEFFIPRQSGKVAPSLKMSGGNTTMVDVHINGVKDFDSFQRSQGQLRSQMHREISLANARNG